MVNTWDRSDSRFLALLGVFVSTQLVLIYQVWDNPKGLEWTVPSPAPYHTFDEPPRVPKSETFS